MSTKCICIGSKYLLQVRHLISFFGISGLLPIFQKFLQPIAPVVETQLVLISGSLEFTDVLDGSMDRVKVELVSTESC